MALRPSQPSDFQLNASIALALSAPLGCNPVSHVTACWLTGPGSGTPNRYLARTLSWNACKFLIIITPSICHCLHLASPEPQWHVLHLPTMRCVCAVSLHLIHCHHACMLCQRPFSQSVRPPIAAADSLELLTQAVPDPVAEEHSDTAANQPRDESLPSTNRSGKAKKAQGQKGKGGGSRPMLQPPVLCTVLPCLQKLELHITGGHIATCLHCYACTTELALLCLHCYAGVVRHRFPCLLQSHLTSERIDRCCASHLLL